MVRRNHPKINLILQLSGLFSKPKVTIEIENEEKRKPYKVISPNGEITRLVALYDKEDVKGKVIVSLGSPKLFEHKGIKLELIGIIENLKDKKDTSKFLSLTNELTPVGILTNESTPFNFSFPSVQKPFETYKGSVINVKYYLKVTISTKFRSFEYEQEFAVIRLTFSLDFFNYKIIKFYYFSFLSLQTYAKLCQDRNL